MKDESVPKRRSIPDIRAREHASLAKARRATVEQGYRYLKTGIGQYEVHLFPEHGSFLETLHALRKLHPNRPLQVLDYGCGHNVAMRELKQDISTIPLEVTGVSAGDPRTAEEKEYDEAHGVRFIDQTSPVLQLGNETYDLIVSRYALMHTFDPLRVLKSLYRALTVGGEMRIHLKKINVADKFINYVGKDVVEALDDAVADFKVILARLAKEGMEITWKGEICVIRKTVQKLKFTNVQYDLDGDHTGDGRAYRRKKKTS